MFGNNPKRPPTKGDGTKLDVQEIFYTFQGEGPFVGHPAVFIRLGGCNLACDFCDTEFESFHEWTLDAILHEVKKIRAHAKLIVLTGGEPFRQPIELLCAELLKLGFEIQLETNGTLYRDLPKGCHIICSPKMSLGTYHPIRPDLLPHISAFKFIVSASHPDYRHVGDVDQKQYRTPVYVQPMDEQDAKKNEANLAYATDLALKEGYRLSLQTHKIAGVR